MEPIGSLEIQVKKLEDVPLGEGVYMRTARNHQTMLVTDAGYARSEQEGAIESFASMSYFRLTLHRPGSGNCISLCRVHLEEVNSPLDSKAKQISVLQALGKTVSLAFRCFNDLAETDRGHRFSSCNDNAGISARCRLQGYPCRGLPAWVLSLVRRKHPKKV